MAKNQVTLTFAGDSKSLERAFDKAGQGARDLGDDFDKAAADAKTMGSRVDSAGSAVGNQESKFMGTADVLDGLSSAFGLNIDRQIELARAAGDISGGIENLKGSISSGVDAVGKMKDSFAGASKAAILTKIETVKTAAAQSIAWVKSSAQAMASAIRVRAAWLISMGPIALVVAAVAGAVFLIVKYWDEIKGAAEATWTWVRDRFEDLKTFFLQWAPLLAGPIGLVLVYWDELKGAATAAKDWVAGRFNDLVSFLEGIPGRIGRGLTGPFEGIKEGASTAKGWVQDRFNDLVEWIGDVPGRIGRKLTGAFDVYRDAATGAKDWIIGRFEDAISWLGGVPGKIGSKLKGAFTGLADAFRLAWNGVARFINGVADFKIGLPGPIPDVHVNFPDLPTFHTGGVFRAPTAGGEGLALLRDGERVIPAGQGGGSTVIFQAGAIQALDPQAAASAVVRAIDEYERRNGQRFARA